MFFLKYDCWKINKKVLYKSFFSIHLSFPLMFLDFSKVIKRLLDYLWLLKGVTMLYKSNLRFSPLTAPPLNGPQGGIGQKLREGGVYKWPNHAGAYLR